MISDTKWESFEIDIKLDPHIKLFTAAMLRKKPKIHYENIEKQTAPHKRKPKFRSQAQTFKLCAFLA